MKIQAREIEGFMGQIPYKQKKAYCANLLVFFSEFQAFRICSEIRSIL